MRPEETRWERVRSLFDEARELPSTRRPAFLETNCENDGIRADVAALLFAHDALAAAPPESFLDRLDAERAAALFAPGPADPPHAEDPAAGDMLGRYRILRPLGRGGMGVVYLARDDRLDRLAAIKLLPRHLSLYEAARSRFEMEARAASAVDHPNIATVYDIGETADHRVFIAMAFRGGDTLRDVLDRGPMPVGRALRLATGVADALAAAHRRGVVHRDIKPGNVIVTEADDPRVVDFGIAQIADAGIARAELTPGTIAYMSPEQTRSGPTDPRSDVWSLGATVYEMLAGRRPFRADTDTGLIDAIRNDEPEPLTAVRPDVPVEFCRIVHRCLRKHPSERYADAGALHADLDALMISADPRRGRRKPHGATWFAAAVLLLAGLLLAGALLIARASGTSVEAWSEYMRGRYYLTKLDEPSFTAARDHFQRAVDADPTFARAWSGLAQSYMQLASIAVLWWDDAFQSARAAAQNALDIDPDLADAHAALAAALSSYYWDSAAAERHFLRAIELDSALATVHHSYAKHLRNLGRFEDALGHARRAQELAPLAAYPQVEEGLIYYLWGRYGDAARTFERILQVRPDHGYVHFHLALVRAQQGRYREAIASLDTFGPEDAESVNSHAKAVRGVVYAMAGRDADARRILALLRDVERERPVSAFQKAAIHVHLGELDQALDLLEAATREHVPAMRVLGVEPIFTALRGNARFEAVLRAAGVQPPEEPTLQASDL